MPAPVSRYRLAWDPVARRGEVAFIAGSSSTAVRIPAPSAEEFNALALVLKEPNVVWDGRILWSDSASGRLLGDVAGADIDLLSSVDQNANRITDACEDEWPANKSECSGFVRDVAAVFGVSLTGQANEIVNQIRSASWTQLPDGRAAKQAADEGYLVVGGLRGDEQQSPSDHGHVVVVVTGPLAKDAYPTAFWGTLGGIGERGKTINWAWRSGDRDRVHYARVAI